MLTLQLNGSRVEVPSSVTTIAELIKHLQLEQKMLVVEHNEQVLAKHAHAAATISDGDRIEIVHFVGGG